MNRPTNQPPMAMLSELSRPLHTDRLPAGGIIERIVARPSERQALAERFDLIELSSLEATLNVDHASDGMVKVTGVIMARVVQKSVVTLEPVTTAITEKLEVLCIPPHLMTGKADAMHRLDAEDTDIEPIENGKVDLGELVCQHLSLALPLYPQ